jgi:hypothetical protein
MTPLVIPFKLRAKIERVNKHEGWWTYNTPFWRVVLTEHAPGLHRSVFVPMDWPGTYSRQEAIEASIEAYSAMGVHAVFRKSPVRKPTLKQRMRDAQTIQRACI